MWLTLENEQTDNGGTSPVDRKQRLAVTPFLLVSRSAEYESRLRGLLGDRLAVIAGEFLTFGVDAVVEQMDGTPRIALLGPVLNFEETQGLAGALTDRTSRYRACRRP